MYSIILIITHILYFSSTKCSFILKVLGIILEEIIQFPTAHKAFPFFTISVLLKWDKVYRSTQFWLSYWFCSSWWQWMPVTLTSHPTNSCQGLTWGKPTRRQRAKESCWCGSCDDQLDQLGTVVLTRGVTNGKRSGNCSRWTTVRKNWPLPNSPAGGGGIQLELWPVEKESGPANHGQAGWAHLENECLRLPFSTMQIPAGASLWGTQRADRRHGSSVDGVRRYQCPLRTLGGARWRV